MRDVTPASKLAGDPDDAHEWGTGFLFEGVRFHVTIWSEACPSGRCG
jgi:hypothetical protein